MSATKLSGHCYCGAVKFEVEVGGDAAPIFTAYCHCDSCRRAHAAPLYRVACIEARHFHLREGGELITEFLNAGKTIQRCFCSRCGSKIYNRFPGWTPGGKTPLVFFPDTLDEGTQGQLPEAYRATRNNEAQDCVLDWERLAAVMPETGA